MDRPETARPLEPGPTTWRACPPVSVEAIASERDALQEELAAVQSQLARSLDRWRELFQILPHPGFEVDRAGIVRRANPAASTAAAAPSVGVTLLSWLHPADAGMLRRALDAARDGEAFEAPLRAMAGEARRGGGHLLVLPCPHRSCDPRQVIDREEGMALVFLLAAPPERAGNPPGADTSGSEGEEQASIRAGVPDKHDLEEARRHPLGELVFAQSSDAIAVVDRQGLILRVNPAFEGLSGAQMPSLRGRTLWVVQPQLEPSQDAHAWWRRVEDEGGWCGEITSRSLDGRPYTVRCTVTPLRDLGGRIGSYAVVQSNLTPLRIVQAQLQVLAAQDELTQLPNRRVLLDRLEQLIHYARRRKSSFALLFCDLDHFKEVNDTLGHQTGDQLLQVVAQRLRASLREQDTVARNGGDEFVILLADTTRDAAQAVAAKLVQSVGEPLDMEGLDEYRPSLSVGIASFPDDGEAAEALLRKADSAMYAAKAAGRGQMALYSQALGEAAADFLDVQRMLPAALARGELSLRYQPKFCLADGVVVGAEALVRWCRPDKGVLLPKHFLGAAQRCGLLTAVDDWVLEAAIRQAAEWHHAGRLGAPWRLSVNQSALDLQRPGWLLQLRSRLETAGLPARHLEIELTEGLLAQPTPDLIATLSSLRAIGVRLSVDDFGTGYSSMAYLKSLPIAVMKIDGGFVRDIVDDASDRDLVEAMISLGRKLGHETVAECVETAAQADILRAIGCDTGQGFFLSEALPAADFERSFLSAV